MSPDAPAELPALLVRGLGLALPILALIGLSLWRRPTEREKAAMITASAWALLTLLPLNLYAVHVGWWTFHAEGALWRSLPVDLMLAWVVLWGALPALLLRCLPVPLLVGALVWLDTLLMPLAEPVVVLGPYWLLGELLGTTLCLIPALLLAHLTRRRALPVVRAWAQAVLAFGLMVALPLTLVPDLPGEVPTALSAETLTVLAQALALACLPGLAAAREFAVVGDGTPLPYDRPRRLVTSGPYAYVRNPMQLTAALVSLVLGAVFPPLWLGVPAAYAYGAGFASWHEGGQLRTAFGADWENYRAGVRPWLPRPRPWPGRARGTLYVAADCSLCRGLAAWLTARRPTALDLRPAAEHPDVLYRLTYEDRGGTRWSGVAALARALEHLHLGWALTGWTLSLPILRHVVQLCADAFGAGPRAGRPTAILVRGHPH